MTDKYYMNKDEWFAELWQDKITPEFAQWWAEEYGLPEEYGDDTHEYFISMAFAFMGWQGAEKTI